MITNEFKSSYTSLNKEQKQAVDMIEGPVMVIAGPGTGKTQILTLRIANILLQTQINPENILALTFSEAASFEMRERLSRIIGTPAYRVEISTFHSFANSIIKNYPDEFPHLLSAESITEIEQLELIEKLLNSLDLKILQPFGDPLYYIRDILSVINDLKKEDISPLNLEDAIKKQVDDFGNIDDLYHEKGKYKGEIKGKYQDLKKDIEKLKEFFVVFMAYQKALITEKKYDFNDMLLEVIKVLKTNKSLLLRVQEKFQYILIDEHQDTNAAQNRLVELIAGFFEMPNLFVVGDEKQAIYRFQGASLENFLYFKKIYPQAKLINLAKNYRSHKTILDASQSLIEKNISANILPKQDLITGTKIKKEKLKVAAFTSFNLEYEYVAADILKKIKHGLPSSEMAVLARRNMDLLPLSQSLGRLGVKFIIQADLNILNDLQIQKLLFIFEAINHPFDEVYLTQAMHVDFSGIDPFDIYEGKESKAIKDFNSKYKGWVKLNNNIPFDDFFVKVINESGFKKHLLKLDARYQVLNKLIGLFDEIKLQVNKDPKFNLDVFLRLLQTVEKHKLSLKAKVDHSLEEGVRLLTVHKSKGLEFNSVYILNCFDSRWGNSRKRGAKIKIPWEYFGENIKTDISFEEIEDERRLFYVALTRAKREVILTYSKFGIDGKEQLPSQFLEEIDKKFLEEIDTAKFEKTFDRLKLLDSPQKVSINPKDKKYLQSLFSEKGLSVTGLENFLECPWKYFFRNLVALPDVKNKHLIFGTAVHFALDSFIKSRRVKKMGINFLLDKFHESLKKEAMTEKDQKEISEKGEKVLKLFYETVIPTWPEKIQSELRVRGVKFEEGVILNGRIDMLEMFSSDNLVRVHDFKTGKIKPRTYPAYFRQLTFYKILLDKYKEGLFKMKEGVIDFVEPDPKGRFRSEVFMISDNDVKELEIVIKSVAAQIINLSFWDQKCDDKTCDYCRLKEMVFN
ncbi:MAG: ATP-dependent DNA helicase [Candidatus Daviesbacteria bacterium]|nr:ATP-dependent DNA helicase [Candidatus Daviesbacteria bacterium]